MDNRDSLGCKLVQAGLDGYFTGADIVGTAIGHITGDERHIGYQADKFGLVGMRKKVGVTNNLKYGISFFSPKTIERGLAEKTVKAVGEVAGFGINLITLGLVNTLHLGNVYCVEERRK